MRRELTDGAVRLREATEADLPAIERGLADPDVVRWFGRTPASAAEVLALNRVRFDDGSGPTFAICVVEDDACVGLVWINRSAADAGQGAVGYWLLPEARGRGLASRAVRLIVDWAFADLVMSRVLLLAEPGNAASLALAARTGFVATGERSPGELFDGRTVEYLVHERRPAAAPPSAGDVEIAPTRSSSR